MSSHTVTSLLLNDTTDTNTTDIILTNATSSTMASVLTTLASTTKEIVTQTTTTIITTTVAPLTTTTPMPEDGSNVIFGFCSILFFVGVALVAKIVYSNRKKYRNMAPSWRLSASRSSGNVPAGFALTRDPFASRSNREPFESARYTAVPPSTNARLASQQQDAFVGNSSAQLEWERQFFEDDAPANDNNIQFH